MRTYRLYFLNSDKMLCKYIGLYFGVTFSGHRVQSEILYSNIGLYRILIEMSITCYNVTGIYRSAIE